MEKVKLTQEQVDAIEDLLKQYGDRKILIHEYLYKTGEINENIEIIKKMDYDQLFSYLYQGIGYELEPEFKVGDWVVYRNDKRPSKIYQIPRIARVNLRYHDDGTLSQVPIDFIRHATPEEIAEEKQRRWFAKHDRKPWELKEGDILSEHGNCQTRTIYRICPSTESIKFYGDVEWTRKYEIRSNYLVACFAKDRKDV